MVIHRTLNLLQQWKQREVTCPHTCNLFHSHTIFYSKHIAGEEEKERERERLERPFVLSGTLSSTRETP